MAAINGTVFPIVCKTPIDTTDEEKADLTFSTQYDVSGNLIEVKIHQKGRNGNSDPLLIQSGGTLNVVQDKCNAWFKFNVKNEGSFIREISMKEILNPEGTPVDGSFDLSITSNDIAEGNLPIKKSVSPAPPSNTANQDPSATSSVNISPNPKNGANSNGGKGNGLANGAVAGIAIAVFVIGLGLGILAAFCFLKRRLARRNLHAVPGMVPSHQQSYHVPPPADTLQLNQFLLDATPDREIAAELRSLKDLIQQHVENNYHLQPVQANPAALAQVLADLGVGQQGALRPDTVARLALNPPSRYAALQHILSEVLFRSVDFGAASRHSMLPTPVAAFATSVPPVERKTGDEEATLLAMSKWRALTAFLLHPTRSQRTALTPNESAIAPQIQALASALNQFLEPFVVPDPNSRFQQTNHLQAVIFECTKLGYIVFSQPGEWAFVHRPVEGGNCLVTCAGVQKVRNKDGVSYGGAGQVVERPVVVPL